MALFKSENPKTDLQFDENGIIPAHVAIIMDGNGRWAKKTDATGLRTQRGYEYG